MTYFPDTYKVSLVVDGEQGAGYARNMLDAIIQSYCTYYTEKYVEVENAVCRNVYSVFVIKLESDKTVT